MLDTNPKYSARRMKSVRLKLYAQGGLGLLRLKHVIGLGIRGSGGVPVLAVSGGLGFKAVAWSCAQLSLLGRTERLDLRLRSAL